MLKKDIFSLAFTAILIVVVVWAGYVMLANATHPGPLTDLSARKRN